MGWGSVWELYITLYIINRLNMIILYHESSIYYRGMKVLPLVVMHASTGTFGAEMMAYIGGWRTKQMQHIYMASLHCLDSILFTKNHKKVSHSAS